MIKKSFALMFIALFLFSILSFAFVSAEDNKDISVIIVEKVTNWSDSWFKGSLSDNSIKILVLVLVFILIYSALGYANFPDTTLGAGSTFTRFLISIVVGILATWFISQSQIVTVLQSYTALGMTLLIFFPIMILVFFNIFVASAGRPIGMFTSRILWAIYSLFLLSRAFLMWVSSTQTTDWKLFGIQFGAYTEKLFGVEAFGSISNPFDVTTEVILIFTAIAVFIIFVWQGKAVDAWMAHERALTDLQAEKTTIERAKAREKLESQALGK